MLLDCNNLMSDLNSIVTCVDKKKWYINATMCRSSSSERSLNRWLDGWMDGFSRCSRFTHDLFVLSQVEIISSICVQCTCTLRANSVHYVRIAGDGSALGSIDEIIFYVYSISFRFLKMDKVYSTHIHCSRCVTQFIITHKKCLRCSNTADIHCIRDFWCINRKMSHSQQIQRLEKKQQQRRQY